MIVKFLLVFFACCFPAISNAGELERVKLGDYFLSRIQVASAQVKVGLRPVVV